MQKPRYVPRAVKRLATAHRPSSPDLVVAAVVKGIRTGRYVAGQRLIEADLTHDLGVSRGPVREALKRLAAEGVVVLSPHRGAYIRALTRSEALALVDVLDAMVGLAARLAAARMHEPEYRKRFIAAYERLKTMRADSDRVVLSIERTSFYNAIFEISGNRELIRMNPVVQTQLLRMQIHAFLSQQDRNRQFADYELLAEALLAGDGKGAERIVRRHARRSFKQIESLPADAFAIGTER